MAEPTGGPPPQASLSPPEATSPSGPRKSKSSSTVSQQDDCAICLEPIVFRGGKPIFDPGCGHRFHFACLKQAYQAGNTDCPLCRGEITQPPSLSVTAPSLAAGEFAAVAAGHADPVPRVPPGPTRHGSIRSFAAAARATGPPGPIRDDDDDAVDYLAPDDHAPMLRQDMLLSILPEARAMASGPTQALSALVSLVAPQVGDADRAPIDLVAVLDKSGSMDGEKMRLLVDTLKFCVEQLAPNDRVSIVTFDQIAERPLRLRQMNGEGKADAQRVLRGLRSGGQTSIAAGLRRAINVLESRRLRATVTAILLLSDGQDRMSDPDVADFHRHANALGAVTHTFGFGNDHDARLLSSISAGGRGNFTYIEELATVRTAFAGCIGGLLSVAAQNVRLQIESCNGARIVKVHAGYPQTHADGVYSLTFNDLFSEEQRDILVELTLPGAQEAGPPEQGAADAGEVPAAAAAPPGSAAPEYLRATCRYLRISAGGEEAESHTHMAIERPAEVDGLPVIDVTVDAQRNRYLTVDALQRALARSEAMDFRAAQAILNETVVRIQSSASAQEPACQNMVADLLKARASMVDRHSMEMGGRAQTISYSSSHSLQRSFAPTSPYQSPSISNMQSRATPGRPR